MSTRRLQNPDLTIGPARGAALVVGFSSVMVAIALWHSGVPIAIRGMLAAAALIYGGFHMFRLLSPRFRLLRLEGDRLHLLDRNGNRQRGQVAGRPFVSPFYLGMIVRAEPDGGRERLGLFRGQLLTDEYRRLSVWLRERI